VSFRAAAKRVEVALLGGTLEVLEDLDDVGMTCGSDQPAVHRSVLDLAFDSGETGLAER